MSRTTKNVCLSLTAGLIEQLDQHAAATERSRSFVVRKALQREFEQSGQLTPAGAPIAAPSASSAARSAAA